jgi:thiamine-phosphate pyrophosphorylase
MRLRPGLYAILDLPTVGARPPLQVAEALLAGGAVALQLRAKDHPVASLEPLARALAERCRAYAVPFLVNDHVTLAVASGADGVHLGQEDVSPAEARRELGPGRVIGLSTHDLAQARAAAVRGADYVGFGPVLATRTKARPDPVQGVRALHDVCRAVALPVVAIGGLSTAQAAAVAAAGAAAAAAIAAILEADDVRSEVERFNRAFRSGRSPEADG